MGPGENCPNKDLLMGLWPSKRPKQGVEITSQAENMNASSEIILTRSFFRSQRNAIMYRYSFSYCFSYIHIYSNKTYNVD